MKPIKKSPGPSATPSAPATASLRLQLRTGKLPQAESSPEPADAREPDELFEPLPPSAQEPNEYSLDMNDE